LKESNVSSWLEQSLRSETKLSAVWPLLIEVVRSRGWDEVEEKSEMIDG